jgi:glycosyltransferase involved in cell wall biosynthesis
MVSPMPPEKTGIADYTTATLAALRPLARVDALPASALAYADRKFDAVLSVIGNAPLHQQAYDHTKRWGSAVLCHDARLLGLATGQGLAHAAQLASAELGRAVSEAEILAWAADETKREASFLGEMAQAARPLIFHSPQPVALVQQRFGVTAQYLPFALQRQFGTPQKQAARAALGISATEKLIVSFGFITRGKGIPAALAALAKLRGPVRLVFAGEATAHTPALQTLAAGLGVADKVHFGPDFLSEADYRAWMAAADAGLQLREGPPGNISGTLQDIISAGLPAVANADLANNLAAPAYVRRVADALNPDEIAAALETTLTTPADTTAERATYCAAHSMARYAAHLLQILNV